jgi:hypothetical protein
LEETRSAAWLVCSLAPGLPQTKFPSTGKITGKFLDSGLWEKNFTSASISWEAIPVPRNREFFAANRENNGNRIAEAPIEIIGHKATTALRRISVPSRLQ